MGVAVSQKEKAFVLEAAKQGYLNKVRAEKVFQKRQRILDKATEKQKLAQANREHRQHLIEQVQNDQKKAKVWQLAILLGYMTADQAKGVLKRDTVKQAGQNNTLNMPSITRPELTLDFMGINLDTILANVEKEDLTEETAVEERYEFIQELGKGGMGEVGLYLDTEMGREVALKKILAGSKDLTEGQILRFQREMEITGKLYRHPGIIQIFDFGRDKDDNLYIAMEAVKGRDLSKILKQVKGFKQKGQVVPRKYSLNNMIKYFVQSLDALQFMHSHNFVHRDLKPDNIMIDEELEQAKVMDLGLAKQIDEEEPERQSDLDVLMENSGKTGVYNISKKDIKTLGKLPKKVAQTLEGQVMGTPSYMSPDQINDSKNVDQRADVYSMGVILYEILTGKKPHQGKSPMNTLHQTLNDETIAPIKLKNTLYEIPKELSAVCMKALSKDAKYRYRNVKEFLDDIQAYINNEPVSVYQDNFWEKIAKWGKRNKKKAGMMLGMGILAPLAIGGVLTVQGINAIKQLSLEKEKTTAERTAKKEAEKRANAEKGRADAEAKAKTEAEGRAEAEAEAKEKAQEAADNLEDKLEAEQDLRELSEKKRKAIMLTTDGLQVFQYALNIPDKAKKVKTIEEAIALYRQAIQMDETLAHAYNNLASALKILGKTDEAVSNYDAAIRLDPNLGKAYYGRGTTRALSGDLSGAILDFEKAKQLMPLFASVYSNLSVCYMRNNDFQKAVTVCDEALRIKPKDPVLLRNKGESLMYLGRHREAEQSLLAATVHGEYDANLILADNLVRAAQSGNPLYADWQKKAREHCDRAVKIDSRLAVKAQGILEKIR